MRKQDTTPCHSLRSLQLNPLPWLQKEPPAVSCATICMKKGPSKNIFLSFQAISLIPNELQGRGKHYGCGLAGGGEGILWEVHEFARFIVCMCVNIWINLHYCEDLFNDSTFYFALLFLVVCVCERIFVWHTQAPIPQEKGLRSLEVAPTD